MNTASRVRSPRGLRKLIEQEFLWWDFRRRWAEYATYGIGVELCPEGYGAMYVKQVRMLDHPTIGKAASFTYVCMCTDTTWPSDPVAHPDVIRIVPYVSEPCSLWVGQLIERVRRRVR